MDLGEMRYENMNWFEVAQVRVQRRALVMTIFTSLLLLLLLWLPLWYTR
jgi:hypothetical protein